MKKILFSLLISTVLIFHASAQRVSLAGIYDAQKAMITLNWNMASSNFRTAYVLLRSSDGISWTEVVKDRMLRNYNADDIYSYNDKNFLKGRNYYRLIISDAENKTVALSTIIKVDTRFFNDENATQGRTRVQPQNNNQSRNIQQEKNNNNKTNWVIYPNPATDYLYLQYRGSESLKGIVNVMVQDASGKTVIKFRSGSMYNNIQVPISNLQRGVYFIQVIVLDELMMNQRFIKQ